MARDWAADLCASLTVCGRYDSNADEHTHNAQKECVNDAARQAGACIASEILEGTGKILRAGDRPNTGGIEPLLYLKLAFDAEWNAHMATLLEEEEA